MIGTIRETYNSIIEKSREGFIEKAILEQKRWLKGKELVIYNEEEFRILLRKRGLERILDEFFTETEKNEVKDELIKLLS